MYSPLSPRLMTFAGGKSPSAASRRRITSSSWASLGASLRGMLASVVLSPRSKIWILPSCSARDAVGIASVNAKRNSAGIVFVMGKWPPIGTHDRLTCGKARCLAVLHRSCRKREPNLIGPLARLPWARAIVRLRSDSPRILPFAALYVRPGAMSVVCHALATLGKVTGTAVSIREMQSEKLEAVMRKGTTAPIYHA